jgi:long-chain acyl-CoA synthetase
MPARFSHPRQVAEVFPERIAFVLADSAESVTYGELARRSDQVANLFASFGLNEGDTVAILAENGPLYPELCWGAKNAGLRYVCVSTHLNGADIGYILENSLALLLAGTHDALDAIAEDLGARASLKILRVGGEDYEAEIAAQPALRLSRIRGASMLYSSGTTGRPKGIRSEMNAVPPEEPPARQRMLEESFGFGEDMVFLNPGPFYHVAPLRMMMAALRLGGTVVGFGKFDAERVLAAIGTYRGTHGFFVPTMFARMLRLPDPVRDAADLSSIRVAIHGAAPCPPSVKEAMIAWWGPVLVEMYGATEGVGHTIITSPEWLAHRGSVGKPTTGCEIRIVGDAGQALPAGEAGLIYLGNGRSFTYHGEDEATARVHDSAGLATLGDIGFLDAEGYLYLTDRQSHMIISGGVNIYPQEIENILVAHPRVADAAVIGVPDADMGERVKAVVEAEGGIDDADVLGAELLAWCRDRLSATKCPRSIDFVDALPRSEAGKLLKRVLREQYWQGHQTLIG